MAEIDHLAFAVPDLDDAVERFAEEWGCRIHPGGRHPRWGSWNAIVPLGGGVYLEVIAPHPEAPASGRRVFGLDVVESPGLRDWAVRPGSSARGIETMAVAAATAGVSMGRISRGSRRAPDGRLLEWRLSDPFADRLGATVPFLIDWHDTPHPSAMAEPEAELLEMGIGHPEPARVRRALEALGLGDRVAVTVVRAGRPGRWARLRTPRGEVRLEG